MRVSRSFWNSWHARVSKRFLLRQNHHTGSEILGFSLIGLILGGITLTVVLSVMNGFQKRFQDNLREITSFHGRITQTSPSFEPPLLPTSLEITQLFPFTETQVLVKSLLAGPEPALVKGISPDLLFNDPSFQELLRLRDGSWNLKEGEVFIGERLAYVLGARVGDSIDLISLDMAGYSLLTPNVTSVRVVGIWESSYYELNRYTLFMPLLDSLKTITREGEILWGLKVRNPHRLVAWQRSHLLVGVTMTNWQQENPVFLGALDFEKRTMTALLALVFVIVGLNTYYSLRQTITRHQTDVAILKAIGASPKDCLKLFMREGFLLGFLGGLVALVLGLTLTLTLNHVLTTIETFANNLLEGVGWLLNIAPPIVSLSLSVEGAQQLPLAIYWSDILLIYTLIYASTSFFAWHAVTPLANQKPTQIMRYE